MIDNDGIEKNLKELLGVSISELRAMALQRPLGDTDRVAQSNVPPSPVTPPPPPQIEVTDQEFTPQSFRSPPAPSQNGDAGTAGGAAHTFIVEENGILYYALLNGTIGAAVT